MSMDVIKKIVDQFHEQGKMIFPEEATEDLITQFENVSRVGR